MSYYILPYQELFKLCEDESISIPEHADRLQPASIDLPIHLEVYELASTFVPHGIGGVYEYVVGNKLIKKSYLIGPDGFDLLTDHIYMIGLNVSLALPSYLSGTIQTRSSGGRNDLFVSVLQQKYPKVFHEIEAGYQGTLWMIVIPQSYPVRIFRGDCLAQLRIVDERQSYPPPMPVYLCLDLIPDGNNISFYRSHKNVDPDYFPIIFDSKKYYSPVGFWWKHMLSDTDDGVMLYPDHLYIMRSVENVQVPPAYAMDLIAYEPGLGEFKTHYAGFFDPGFGVHQPTRAVFEIRVTHPTFVTHGQRIAKMQYLRLLQETDHPYVGTYQGQGLRLGKQFREPNT